MTTTPARQTIRSVLHEVAPDVDLDECGPDENLRETLDLDSVDFLNFVIGLHDATGLDIPERDYDELATPRGCADYLSSRL